MPDARRPSRAAVNALRTLLERHNHIVQEVDCQNDFGEDQHVTFTENGEVTGDLVKVQVKGGRSWRRAEGYAVPICDHGGTWADGNIPVLCVVHDPDTDGLYWANATRQLLSARRNGEVPKTITISPDQELDDESIADFVAEVRGYLSRYRGNRIIQAPPCGIGMTGTKRQVDQHVPSPRPSRVRGDLPTVAVLADRSAALIRSGSGEPEESANHAAAVPGEVRRHAAGVEGYR